MTASLGARLRRFRRERRGAAAVEFGFVAPVFLLIVVAMIDFGGRMVETMSLDSAVRAGLEYARVNPEDTSGIQTVVTSATKATSVTATAVMWCQCGTTPTVCTSTCGSGENLNGLVTITATAPFDTILPYPDAVMPATLTARGSVRFK